MSKLKNNKVKTLKVLIALSFDIQYVRSDLIYTHTLLHTRTKRIKRSIYWGCLAFNRVIIARMFLYKILNTIGSLLEHVRTLTPIYLVND